MGMKIIDYTRTFAIRRGADMSAILFHFRAFVPIWVLIAHLIALVVAMVVLGVLIELKGR
jgi:hypothetical protein